MKLAVPAPAKHCRRPRWYLLISLPAQQNWSCRKEAKEMSFLMRSRNVRVFWTGDGPAKIRSRGNGSGFSSGYKRTQRAVVEISYVNSSACFPDAMSAHICAPFNGVSARSGCRFSRRMREHDHPKHCGKTGLPLPSFHPRDRRQRVWTLLPFLCSKKRALQGVQTHAHPIDPRHQKSCRHASVVEQETPSTLPQLSRKGTLAGLPGVLPPSQPNPHLLFPRRREVSA